MRKLATLTVLLLAPFFVGCVPETYKFSREFCKPGNGRGEIMSCTDLAMGDKGEIVIGDAGNYRFQMIDPKDGKPQLVAGSYGTDQFSFKSMAGIGVNALTGEVLVCDFRGDKVVLFDKGGTPKLRIYKDVKGPTDAAFDRNGFIYVVMRNGGPIYKYDILGKLVEKIGGTGKSALVAPSSIFVWKDFFFITDTGSRRLVKMDMKGNTILEITQKGEYEIMRGPSSVFVDKEGFIYLTDLGEVPVVKFGPDGQFISKLGDLGEGEGKFIYPRSLAVNDKGDVIVLDNSRNCLIVFQAKPQ